MRRIPVAAVVAVLTLAVCASSRGTSDVQFANQAPAQASATPPAVCNLTPTGDVIVRVSVPDLPPFAMRMGGVDQVHCASVFAMIALTTTTAAGYCTEVALVSDNSDYDFGFTPAPPLRNVRVRAGGGCD